MCRCSRKSQTSPGTDPAALLGAWRCPRTRYSQPVTRLPNGWKSNAVRDFIFVSRRAKMIPVSNPEACLRHCYMRTDCKSANLVKSKWKLDKQTLAKFNCHLNEQSQFDRPELLVPQKGVIYYDSIHCTTPDESI
ncbi:Uncharacterized protein TSPI_07266 [Trichinella spiralis]|uniref:Apple domain-containing protein n=1 Tax=Trichinella spiralis TaxID=6334 RepID=A0ABR3KLI9_TRISP